MTPILSTPIGQRSAWRSADFAGPDGIAFELTGRHIDALDEILRRVEAAGLGLDDLERRHFDHPALNDDLAGLFEEIQQGRGIVLLRRLPTERYSEAQLGLLFWGIGTHFGRGVSQSVMGDRLGHVRDMTRVDPHARGYRNNKDQVLHTDLSEIVGMLSLTTAKAGGESRYASALAIHNEILAQHPEYLEALYRGFPYHRHGEEKPGQEPITPFDVPVFSLCEGQLSCRYIKLYITLAAAGLGRPLPPLLEQALAYFDEVAHRPDVMLEFVLQPGEMTFLNNFTVLHSRGRFLDHEDPARQRHLLRLWLDVREGRPVVPEIEAYEPDGGIVAQEGKTPSFDPAQLRA